METSNAQSGAIAPDADLIGESESVRTLRADVTAVAPLQSTVLVTGETGVGKGLVARAIHRSSQRRTRAFVHVDCAALPPTLVESELFGHERGAFTGAVARRAGRFEQAAGGTIFLDEIGDLEARQQARLLRVLQDRVYERLGGSQTLRMTARVVAATTRDLAAEVRAGRFRADLYYRLDVLRVAVAPLRQRPTDVPLLVAAGFERLGARLGLAAPTLSKAALDRLVDHAWPGNVRELLNVVERMLVRHAGRPVGASDLDAILDDAPPTRLPPALRSDARRIFPTGDPSGRIASELRAASGNVSRAARNLGLPRSTLRRWIHRYGVRV